MHHTNVLAFAACLLASITSASFVLADAERGGGEAGPNDSAPLAKRPVQRDRPTPAETSSSERHSVVYAQAEGGYETLALRTLRAVNQYPTEVRGSTSGAVYGIGAGVHLGVFTLGGRYRTSRLTGMNLSTVNAELGARIPIERFEPYILMGGGYAYATSEGQALSNAPDVSIGGVNARAGLGLDYYPDPHVSLGANVMGEVLSMARPGFSATQSPEAQANSHLASCADAGSLPAQRSCALNLLSDAEGSSFAVGATFSLVMGLHF